MKIENFIFWGIIISMLAYSCTKELPPSFLAGKYNAFNYEIEDCSNPNINVAVNLNKPDSIYEFNCDTIIVSCDTIIDSFSHTTRVDTFDTLGVLSFFFRLDSVTFDTTTECLTDLINCDEAVYNSITMEIDSLGNYELIVDRDWNGVNEVEKTTGEYISTGFNDINFCVTDCLDSLWYPGLFVKTNGSEVNISWRDTISTQCGYLFQGDRIN